MSKDNDPGWGCLLSLVGLGAVILLVIITFVSWVIETDHREAYTEYAWRWLQGLWRMRRELW